MKIGICDDIQNFCDTLKSEVTRFIQTNAIDAQVVQYFSGKSFLEDREPCDILFLDMELGDVTGIEVLEQIKKRGLNTIVLVVTAFSHYIDSALDYHILRYIEKPVEPERIDAALHKAIELLNEEYIVIYDLKSKAQHRLAFREIILAETRMRKIFIYTNDNTYVLKEGFKALKSKLKASYFAEPHYSFVVNMNFIKCFKRTEIIMDINGMEKTIHVSGEKQHQLRQRYCRFLGEQ